MKRLLGLAVVATLLACGCSGSTDDDEDFSTPDDPAAVSALTAGWSVIGNGVAYKATGDGDGVFIGYAGYSVTLDRSAAWVDALDAARLKSLHVGYLYAVRGPSDAGYNNKDIGNSKLATHLVNGAGPTAPFIMAGAHSSGTYVANELFGQIFEGSRDPQRVLTNKLLFGNLDGGDTPQRFRDKMIRSIFVWAEDPSLSHGMSANAGGMESLGGAHNGLRLVVNHSGCHSGAKWCLHDLLITTKPHDPDRFDLVRDYTDFAGRPVQDGWVRALETSIPD